MQSFRLDGRRALVTGGSRGIGLAIARLYVEAGASVVIAARDASRLSTAVEELRIAEADVGSAVLDISRPDTLEPAFVEIERLRGPFDILVNGAAAYVPGPALNLPWEDFAKASHACITGTFALSQAFAKALIARGAPGRIVNVASIASVRAINVPNAGYVAAKGGVAALTRQLAAEWAQYGILVNALAPGWTATEMTGRLQQQAEFDGWVKSRVPLKRWCRPEEVAGAALLLASDAGAFMTGSVITIDGGLSATS